MFLNHRQKKNAKSLLYKNIISIDDENGLVKHYPNCVLQYAQLYMIWFTTTDDDKQNHRTVCALMHKHECPNLKLWNSKNNSNINRRSLKGKNCWYINVNSNHLIKRKIATLYRNKKILHVYVVWNFVHF